MSLEGSYRKLGAANLKRIEQYVRRIKSLMNKATGRFIDLSVGVDYDKSKGQFYFADYPELKKAVEKAVNGLAMGMEQTIIAGTSAEWTRGTKDANGILDYLVQKTGIDTSEELEGAAVSRLLNNHDAALAAFQRRRIGGITLSSKVWNLANQSKIEAELARSIADGTSASDLAESMQELLNEPSKLFRRVRDEFGVLQLSKNAKAYNPGAGVYRSSYKNALRLARTEINMAYRNAEQASYVDDRYVVGIEIKRSNNYYDCPVCESLKGRYPKDFKWSGWHPNCRCFMVPILVSDDEFLEMLDDESINPEQSENFVGELPDSIIEYYRSNESRVADARERGSLPYVFRDNEQTIFRQMFDPSGNMQTGYVEFYADRKYLKESDGTFTVYGTREECRRQLEQWKQLQSSIKSIAPEFDSSCSEVLSEMENVRFSGIAYKSRGSAVRKADTKFGGDLSKIEDLVRCNFSCSSVIFGDVCDKVREKMPNLYKDLTTAQYMHQKETGHGYRCQFMNVAFPGKVKGEIMVTPFDQLAGRESERMARKFMGDDIYDKIKRLAMQHNIKLGDGHRLYEIARIADTPEEAARLYAEIDKYYDSLREFCDPFKKIGHGGK